jgi:DNA-binding transcriptional MerR regulator
MTAMTDYSLSDLCDLADVTPRTVRYYVAQGLLPKPTGFGPGAHYSDEHLSRLRLIRRLQREHLPLAEIRRRLEGLRDEDIDRLATGPGTSRSAGMSEGSALDYVRGLLGGQTAADLQPASPSSAPLVATMRLGAAPAMDASASAMPLGASPAEGALAPDAQTLMHRLASASAAEGWPGPAPDGRPATTSTSDRSQWDRIALSPDVEVHVRRPLSRHQNRQVDRLLEAGRQIFEEEAR